MFCYYHVIICSYCYFHFYEYFTIYLTISHYYYYKKIICKLINDNNKNDCKVRNISNIVRVKHYDSVNLEYISSFFVIVITAYNDRIKLEYCILIFLNDYNRAIYWSVCILLQNGE